YQCRIQSFYKGCEKGLPLNHLVLAEKPDDVDHYHGIICSCAYQTERIGYKHFAIKEEGDNTIACYAVDYNPSGVDIVLNDLNRLLLQSQCSQKCDKIGCALMGTGDYAAVYQVIPSTVTLPRTTMTTVRTEVLRSTTRKQFVRPPPPQDWD
ncbi:Hypothetical predicted protein, partial [Paramuricea clavata]